MSLRHHPHTLVPAILVVALLGCGVTEAVEPLQPTPFVTRPELLAKPKFTPFDLAWRSSTADSREFNTLIVEAVHTEQINPDNWMFSASTVMPSRRLYLERVQELADYIQRTISKRFDRDEEQRWPLVVEKAPPVEPLPSPLPLPLLPRPTEAPVESVEPPRKTLRLQISIAEANFGDPLVYGGLLAVPVPGAANLSTAVKSPSLTLEARFVDDATGEVLAEIVDRRFPQVKPIDVNRLTVSSALREIVDSFAEDLVRSFFRRSDERVGRRFPFSLIPW